MGSKVKKTKIRPSLNKLGFHSGGTDCASIKFQILEEAFPLAVVKSRELFYSLFFSAIKGQLY